MSAPAPAVTEDGAVLFDLSAAQYSISGENGRCLLHLWSSERNVVRRVLEVKEKNGSLQLTVQRMGRTQPFRMEILRVREHTTPSSLKAAREQYRMKLRRVVTRWFPDWKAGVISSTMDLEKSFGPAYARGFMRRGRAAWACVGVAAVESQATIDGSLTVAILWLDHLREKHANEFAVEGVKLFVPKECSQVVRMRASHLDHERAKFEVWELDEDRETVEQTDIFDHGNVYTKLTRCPDRERLAARYAESLARIERLVPHFEAEPVNAAELSLRVHGLEFARVRSALVGESMQLGEEIVFGIGPAQTTLSAETEPLFLSLIDRVMHSRGKENDGKNVLWRTQPERWMESMIATDVSKLDDRLCTQPIYAQVPAFSAADRGVIDILCRTDDGRLAVVEIKADDDLHLPLQGLDYWMRVRHHHEQGEFQSFGYFQGIGLSKAAPLLLLVAPALHLHPATETILRYLSPAIDWTVIGVDERWRRELKVVFRKRRSMFTAERAFCNRQ